MALLLAQVLDPHLHPPAPHPTGDWNPLGAAIFFGALTVVIVAYLILSGLREQDRGGETAQGIPREQHQGRLKAA